LAALAAILIVLFHEALFGGRGLVPADGILAYPPWKDYSPPGNYLLMDQYAIFIPEHDFTHQQMVQGRLSLWNPYLACGMPNQASIQAASWFPIQFLGSFLDPFYASGPTAFLKLFLAGLFAMLYLRVLGASDAGAFLAGISFSLCAFMIVWLGHPHVNCAMWLPLLLYFIEKTIRSTDALIAPVNLRAWAGFALAYGCMILGGHPPTVIQVSVFVFAYFLWRLLSGRSTNLSARVGLFFGFLSVGALVAALQIIPYLEYYAQSSSSSSSDAMQRWAMHLTPAFLVHWLFPLLTGSPADGYEDLSWLIGVEDTANFCERTGYLGILPLLFAAFGVFCRRDPFTKFFSVTILMALVLALGLPPLPTIMSYLPVLKDINNTRYLLLAAFSVAVLAGLGLDSFNQSENRSNAIRISIWFVALVGGTLSYLGGDVIINLHRLDSAHRDYLLEQFLMPLGSVIVVGFIFLKSSPGGRWFRTAVILGWTAVDLLTFARGFNPAETRERYYPGAPAIAWLQKDAACFRILGLNNALVADTASMYGLSDARGSDFMEVRRYEELITGGVGDFGFYRYPSLMPEALRLLNVKYVLSPGPLLQGGADFELVYTNRVNIYRYKKWLPRALAVFDSQVEIAPDKILRQVRQPSFDPAKTVLLEQTPESLPAGTALKASDGNASVQIVSDQPDAVTIETSLPKPGFLLLLDTYFPGWTATVNGQPSKIYRADYDFRAVAMPAGKASVTFSYRPQSFYLGLGVSTFALLALGVIFIWPVRQGKVSP
jgi:hypothetical protein